MAPRLNRLFLETTSGAVVLERGFGPFDRREIAADINIWLDGGSAPGEGPDVRERH